MFQFFCERIQSGSWVGMMALTCCRIVFSFKGGYVCIPGCLSVVYQGGFGGDPRHSALREQSPSMEGNLRNLFLGSTCILWQRALWHLELFAIWEFKAIFHDPLVHGAHEINYLPLFDIVAPGPLCFRSPSEFWCGGIVRVCPFQWHAVCQPRKQYRHRHTVPTYRCWDSLWDYTTM